MQRHDDHPDCEQVHTVKLSHDFFLLPVVAGHTLVLPIATAASTSYGTRTLPVNETVRRLLTVATVALDHHGVGLKEGCALAGDEIRLELNDVHVQRTVDTERCSQEKMNCDSRRC